MISPPDYLEGKVTSSAKNSPIKLLQGGQWCGHGEPKFNVFDVKFENEDIFTLCLPKSGDIGLNAPLVLVSSDSGAIFSIYDSRKHPASIYFTDNISESEEHLLPHLFHCPNCDKQRFNLSVGFEIPSDSQSPNDTSWFALAVKCVECQRQEIIYDDETA